MNKSNMYLATGVCVLFAGCAGLNAQKRAARDASGNIAAAETSVASARRNGAASCAAKELKSAESDLQSAKGSLEKKAYDLALTLAKSADSSARAAVQKCEEAKLKKKRGVHENRYQR